ncbi:hypothetical protein HPP92_020183 [Vanilla planifolia]|uniref:Uncharacterized protein n=1 Tax=Vanilla planifolia TaxID=51239 RepID=A0A835Q6R7_VANPL|nr:hypothetical protein HPP92_020183 [Vanilla planifolia]
MKALLKPLLLAIAWTQIALDSIEAKSEWYEIVEGSISYGMVFLDPMGKQLGLFLAYFQSQILRRASDSFCFSNGSIGNFFFAGARMFFQSLDATIFLFFRVL